MSRCIPIKYSLAKEEEVRLYYNRVLETQATPMHRNRLKLYSKESGCKQRSERKSRPKEKRTGMNIANRGKIEAL